MPPKEKKSTVELALIDSIASFKNDPLGFVRYAFPWGEKKSPLSPFDGPDEWQVNLLSTIRDQLNGNHSGAIRVAVASGHGVGKTAVTAWLILWYISTHADPQIVVTANTKTQLETKTWRELSVWHERLINKHWFTHTATKFFVNESPSTWAAFAIPWSAQRPEAFAGTHAENVLVIFDEASAIDDVIWEVAEGALTSKDAIQVAFGNPTMNTGRFRECWGGFAHRWETIKVDSRTAAMADKPQIQQWLEDYGEDSDFFRVRVKGEFPRASVMQFIAQDVVEEAMRREIDADSYRHQPVILGVDVARYGDDRSVIAVRQGLKVHELRFFEKIDTMTYANKIVAAMDEYSADYVMVDAVGVGAGVVDRLRQLGRRVLEVNAGCKPTSDNFFDLRCHKDAQPEIRNIAEKMLECIEKSSVCPIAINALKINSWSI
jgi:hypothetical protein